MERKLTIVTNYKPLQWLFNLNKPKSRLVRWRTKTRRIRLPYSLQKGKQNANALSRAEINAIENESNLRNPGNTNDDITQYLISGNFENVTLENS